MSRPVLFVIDADAEIARALRDDLSRRFGKDFRVIAESSAAGLATLRELAAGQHSVALLIADHHMPEMPGAEFLVLTGRDAAQGPAWSPDRAPFPMETSMLGVFAAGDARYGSIKRVASAAGDGATAVRLTQEYLAAEHAGGRREPGGGDGGSAPLGGDGRSGQGVDALVGQDVPGRRPGVQ
jgi:hypothetical protein